MGLISYVCHWQTFPFKCNAILAHLAHSKDTKKMKSCEYGPDA